MKLVASIHAAVACAAVWTIGCASPATVAATGLPAAGPDAATTFGDTGNIAADAAAKAADTAKPADTPAPAADAAPADTAAAIPDATTDAPTPATCPGAAGCSCANATDCSNVLCLDTADGKRCAAPCGSGCPQGQTCVNLPGAGGKSTEVCVWKWGKLCYPCNATKDCEVPGVTGALCADQGTLGGFCGAACTTSADCPNGYACQVAQSPEGPKSLQCVKIGTDGKGLGTCSCTAAAKAGSLSTACFAEQLNASGKVVGKCPGTRTCGPTGLGACTLVAVKAEVCDGVDNDCNGQVDDSAGGCAAGETCISGKCAGGCSCDPNATCAGGVCTCKAGFTGDGKTCAADCNLPWGGAIASGKAVTAWQAASVACGGTCAQETRSCTNGVLSGSYASAACAVAACGGQCPAVTIEFDWGSSGSGPCHVKLPAGTSGGWFYTDKTDANLGGILASCNETTSTWQISQQKCVPGNGATTCFAKGTKCDGSGPAVFPYPHCWTCCGATDPVPGVCN